MRVCLRNGKVITDDVFLSGFVRLLKERKLERETRGEEESKEVG